MVSIKDIARECKVSVATVSKALNDHDDISAATKERIRKTAKKMGYTINVSARALKTNKTYNLGVLFADERAGLAHEYFSMILESFQKEAEKYGYDITFINHAIAGKQTTYLHHAEYRALDGVAIMTADFNDPEIIELTRSSIPVVSIDYAYPDCAAVFSNNDEGLGELVHYACAQGHRRIAFISGDDTDVTRKRIASFERACKQLGLDIPPEYRLSSHYHDIRECASATRQLLELKDPPTLIIFPDDYSYIGGLEVISKAGLNIPNDISVIGYDGINMAKLLNLTTYEQNTRAIGQLAARKLIQLINEPDLPAEQVIVPGRILEGKTVKKVDA